MTEAVTKWIGLIMRPDAFKPALPADEINKKYPYWRLRIMGTIFIGYAIYYFTRGTLAIIMPDLKAQGYSEVWLGLMITFFQISYGFSKFASGIIADQSNPRYFMGIGLIITGIINVVFGFVPSISILILLWTLNGYFQGWGSAPCHRILTHWYSKSERGRWWGFWNTSHNVGAALLPLFATFVMEIYGLKSGMYLPGIVAIITGAFLMIGLRDTPQSLGLPPIEVYRNEVSNKEQGATAKEERELTTKEILFTYVLNNKWVWGLATSYFLIYIVRWSLSQWIFHFLVDAKHAEKWMAAKTIFWFEAGGFIGGLVAGFFSDVIFKGKRGPVNVIFSLLMIPALILLWKTAGQFSGDSSPITFYFIMGLTGLLIFGPQMLIAVAAAEVSHKKAAATAVGFLGVIAYVGCSLTGGPLGYMIQNYGWDFYFITLIVCSALASLCLVPFLKR